LRDDLRWRDAPTHQWFGDRSDSGGAILGDHIGYTIGREGGFRLVRRHGPTVRLDERKLKLGQYLFLQHGGKVIFFGRFIAILGAWATFLAGVNCRP
jgi:membrane protein DedA with SNARE-associated domain